MASHDLEKMFCGRDFHSCFPEINSIRFESGNQSTARQVELRGVEISLRLSNTGSGAVSSPRRCRGDWVERNYQSAILVHAFDRFSDLEEFLDRFAAIQGPELIAVIGPRKDFQRATEQKRDRVKLLYQDVFWKSMALSQALQQCEAEIIVLTDIDCWITQDWFDRLLTPILRDGEDVVTGPSLPSPSFHPFVQYQRSHDLTLIAARGRYIDGIFGRNTAVQRTALERAGGFNLEIRTGDDYWLGTQLLKAGYRIRFLNNPIQSRYETSPWSYLRQQSRWLRNILSIGSQHKRDHELRSAWWTVAISCLLVLSALGGAWHWRLALPAVAIFGWGAWRRQQRVFRAGPHWKAALLAPFFQVLDHMARILALFRYLIPNLRNRW